MIHRRSYLMVYLIIHLYPTISSFLETCCISNASIKICSRSHVLCCKRKSRGILWTYFQTKKCRFCKAGIIPTNVLLRYVSVNATLNHLNETYSRIWIIVYDIDMVEYTDFNDLIFISYWSPQRINLSNSKGFWHLNTEIRFPQITSDCLAL